MLQLASMAPSRAAQPASAIIRRFPEESPMSCIRIPSLAALALCASLVPPAFAQESATLAKIKSSGTIALGHRESYIPFS